MVSRSRHRRFAGLSATLIAGAVLAGCGSKGVQDVVVARAASGAINATPSGIGTVAAAVDVAVSVDVRDDVTQVQVKPGDHVSKGQPLFGIDPTPLQQESALLASRLQGLQADVGRQQGALAYAEARGSPEVPGIQAQIQSLQGEIALTQQLLDIASGRSATITAPLDGWVAKVTITPGLRVSPGASLVDIVDFTRIEVTANLNIAEAPNIAAGATAQITFPTLVDLTLPAVVRSVPPVATTNGTTVQVVVDAANTPDLKVRPDIQATVRVNVSHQAAVVVNKLAVLNIDQDPTVFVVDGQVAHRRHVQIGLSDENRVEILSGVSARELAVIVGNQALDDGTPVRIIKVEGA